jgi:hypothetical protein
LRASSREIVDGLRCSRVAIERIDSPAARATAISSRPANVRQRPFSPRPRRGADAAGLGQHPSTRAPTGVDDSDGIGDETAVGHHLPEPLEKIRTNEDRILSHATTPNQ